MLTRMLYKWHMRIQRKSQAEWVPFMCILPDHKITLHNNFCRFFLVLNYSTVGQNQQQYIGLEESFLMCEIIHHTGKYNNTGHIVYMMWFKKNYNTFNTFSLVLVFVQCYPFYQTISETYYLFWCRQSSHLLS